MDSFKLLEATISEARPGQVHTREEVERSIATLHTLIKAKESEYTYRLHLVDMLEKSRVFYENKLAEVEKKYCDAEDKLHKPLKQPPKPPTPPPIEPVKVAKSKKSPRKRGKFAQQQKQQQAPPQQPLHLTQATFQVQPVPRFDPSITSAAIQSNPNMMIPMDPQPFQGPMLPMLPTQPLLGPQPPLIQQQLLQQQSQMLPQQASIPQLQLPPHPPQLTQTQNLFDPQPQQLPSNQHILQARDENCAILDSLYGGKQCSNCSLRFSDSTKYDIHLDWHFRQNLKSEIKLARRKWYYPHHLWVQFREINDDDLQENNVDNNQLNNLAVSEDLEVPTAPASKLDENNICPVCHETFEKFWAEEDEEWRLRNAKLYEDERIYHPPCLKDMLASKTN